MRHLFTSTRTRKDKVVLAFLGLVSFSLLVCLGLIAWQRQTLSPVALAVLYGAYLVRCWPKAGQPIGFSLIGDLIASLGLLYLAAHNIH